MLSFTDIPEENQPKKPDSADVSGQKPLEEKPSTTRPEEEDKIPASVRDAIMKDGIDPNDPSIRIIKIDSDNPEELRDKIRDALDSAMADLEEKRSKDGVEIANNVAVSAYEVLSPKLDEAITEVMSSGEESIKRLISSIDNESAISHTIPVIFMVGASLFPMVMSRCLPPPEVISALAEENKCDYELLTVFLLKEVQVGFIKKMAERCVDHMSSSLMRQFRP